MNKEIKEKWVSALRSGEYEQGSGRLRNYTQYGLKRTDTFCCLGVLCDIAEKEGVDSVLWTGDHYRSSYQGVTREDQGYLPMAVMEWAELDERDPIIQPGDIAAGIPGTTLAGLNDSDKNFAEIASIIEENL